ncbi:cytochrome c-type biogenesis protein [Shewanella sp. UCD-KL12]|uniref:cytochrome c-type biogenesis protein n=1 Tax=Shewanella sp. UCD-KL12 TaxID=1917163 RepID=UPI000970368E|nr:cytochrome c-type biogenesis protein [Shewanella sp. UCD-KL12]
MKHIAVALLLVVFTFSSAFSSSCAASAEDRVIPKADPITYTSEQKHKLRLEISRELRCPKSINQNLLDSQAPIASELKAQIYLMLEQGHSKVEIVNFMVERYGEKIRYMPSLSGGTTILWLAPLLFVLIAIASVFIFIRPRMIKQTEPVHPSQVDGSQS